MVNFLLILTTVAVLIGMLIIEYRNLVNGTGSSILESNPLADRIAFLETILDADFKEATHWMFRFSGAAHYADTIKGNFRGFPVRVEIFPSYITIKVRARSKADCKIVETFPSHGFRARGADMVIEIKVQYLLTDAIPNELIERKLLEVTTLLSNNSGGKNV